MKELFFNPSGKFKILQFTDIHYTNGNTADHKTTKLMEMLIREEKPEFIIMTGDTVYGPDNLENLTKALKPVMDSGIPWSYTFGNHDTEDGVDETVLFSKLMSLPGCVVYNADPWISGMANHYLEIKTQEGAIKWILFGIDSGNYNKLENVGGYSYVKSDQIDWYKKVTREYKQKDSDSSSLVFMHIPLPEYREVWGQQQCSGNKKEGVCSPDINSGFFTAILEEGHTKGIFVGHDHINDYMGSLYGIKLGYGRATGYNTYGQEGYLKGARILVLDENNNSDFETYIRLEDSRKEWQ